MHRTTLRAVRQRSGAFTLVEILIVVVILGILAAIVVPQFARATEDATRTATFDQLCKIRRAVSVYYFKNNGTYPDVTAGNGTWGAMLGNTGQYLREPPNNQWVGGPNAKVIVLGAAADAAFDSSRGWIYNPATGDVWAAGFDANDQPLPRP
jgi:general secretion pathway protein G